jgi:nucleoredoxin
MKNSEQDFGFWGNYFLSQSGHVQPSKVLSTEGIVIALFFGGAWSMACENFLPEFVELYRSWNQRKRQIEVIYVSRDRNQEEFEYFFGRMPWLAVPYEDINQIDDQGEQNSRVRSKAFGVVGVPTVAFVTKSGRFIGGEGMRRLARGQKDIWDYGSKAISVFQAMYDDPDNR